MTLLALHKGLPDVEWRLHSASWMDDTTTVLRSIMYEDGIGKIVSGAQKAPPALASESSKGGRAADAAKNK